MSKTHKSDAHQDAQNELIQELEQEIIYLRSLINAYENLTTYNDKEFRDIQSIIQAYEKLQEFQSREKADAETTIDAFKQITEMTAQELRDSRETISAYQHLSELHDREVMNAKETIDAMEQTSELSQSELKNFHDRFESLRRLGHPIQREMFAILDEDHENEQHLLMKLNLLNLRRNDRNFHSHLFNVLVNLDFEETEAKRYWDDILALNREVSEKLGRKVSFRVSMLDYFIDLNKHIRNPKIIEFKFFESAMNNAIFDKLTGLFNRTHLHIAMQSSIRNARRENSLVGIIMFDIDDFKRFNDFFGHPEGDTLLKSFGKILARTFTGTNTVFRYGGEEFLAIVETTDPDMVQEIADRVRTELSSQWKNCILPVSVSGGYSIYPDDGESVEELISRADNALYEAKYSGKNIVLKYSESRRKNSRLFTCRDIFFKIKNSGDDTEYSARTLDISRGGLAIETTRKLEIDDKVELYLDESERSEDAVLSGEICWIHEKENNGEKHFIAGVKLVDLKKSSDVYKYHTP